MENLQENKDIVKKKNEQTLRLITLSIAILFVLRELWCTNLIKGARILPHTLLAKWGDVGCCFEMLCC